MFVARLSIGIGLALLLGVSMPARGQEKLNVPPPGFTALFNGKDLTNWRGMPLKPNSNAKAKANRPYVPMSMPERRKATSEELAAAYKLGDELAREHWKVIDGVLTYDGTGRISLVTAQDYGDFELYCDWKIKERGDSGIYLRGTPQVQIWDPFNMPVTKNGEEKGSGSLWNNKKGERFPDVRADNPIGEWNTFYIKMVGEKVNIDLNGKRVVNNVTLENYWEPDQPVYSTGPIELQDHGNTLYFRNIYIKELPRK
jgi:hypothetical protein